MSAKERKKLFCAQFFTSLSTPQLEILMFLFIPFFLFLSLPQQQLRHHKQNIQIKSTFTFLPHCERFEFIKLLRVLFLDFCFRFVPAQKNKLKPRKFSIGVFANEVGKINEITINIILKY